MERPYGAVVGVLQTVLQLIESGDTYLGVATDRRHQSVYRLHTHLPKRPEWASRILESWCNLEQY